jgi:hypothetical protein
MCFCFFSFALTLTLSRHGRGDEDGILSLFMRGVPISPSPILREEHPFLPLPFHKRSTHFSLSLFKGEGRGEGYSFLINSFV